MTSTNFGDLRSAVHAEQDREQRVKEVLATYEGDPHRALSYVRDNGVLNIVSEWEGVHATPRIAGRPNSSLWRLGDECPKLTRLDKGPLKGFINVGDQAIELIHVEDDPKLHQSWALENVRLPAFDIWSQFLNDQTLGLEDKRPWDEANNLIGDILAIHHPAFIAGEIDVDEWAQRGFTVAEAIAHLEGAIGFRAVFSNDSAWHATTAFARIATKDSTREQRIAELTRLELHHGAWLIDRFGWNAWGGAQ